jgi:hypothetical protein
MHGCPILPESRHVFGTRPSYRRSTKSDRVGWIMPFTVSHVAAALPLQRLLGSRAVFSALAIGATLPDLPYFLPIGVPRHVTHSELGLLYYCLPVGLLCYVAFHYVLKSPLLALLPAALRGRVLTLVAPLQTLPRASWVAVALSLLAGSASHLAWDAFTHGDTYVVRNAPWLQITLWQFGGEPVPVYAALQHVSTLLGILVLLVVALRRIRRARPAAAPLAVDGIRGWQQWSIVGMFVACSLSTAVVYAPQELFDASNLAELRDHIGLPFIQALRALGVTVLGYCVCWQAVRILCARRDRKLLPTPSCAE